MHVPDGFLSGRVAVAAAGLSAGAVAIAVRQARGMPRRRVPMMGLAAAFIFAAQMINFPIGAGTSGHLVGGVMAAVLLGPGAAVIALTCVLVVQCFVFADGGITALGANVFNMAVVGAVGGYGMYWVLARVLPGERGKVVAVGVAAWAATVAAAVVCAAELAMSGVVAWRVVWPAMAGVHAIIGVGEAVITAMVVGTVGRVRPELVGEEVGVRGFPVAAVGYGLILALGLVAFVGPVASSAPDGLERVAMALGFEAAGQGHEAPVADYAMPGIKSPGVSTAAAGVVGVAVAFGVAAVTARLANRPPRGGGGE